MAVIRARGIERRWARCQAIRRRRVHHGRDLQHDSLLPNRLLYLKLHLGMRRVPSRCAGPQRISNIVGRATVPVFALIQRNIPGAWVRFNTGAVPGRLRKEAEVGGMLGVRGLPVVGVCEEEEDERGDEVEGEYGGDLGEGAMRPSGEALFLRNLSRRNLAMTELASEDGLRDPATTYSEHYAFTNDVVSKQKVLDPGNETRSSDEEARNECQVYIDANQREPLQGGAESAEKLNDSGDEIQRAQREGEGDQLRELAVAVKVNVAKSIEGRDDETNGVDGRDSDDQIPPIRLIELRCERTDWLEEPLSGRCR